MGLFVLCCLAWLATDQLPHRAVSPVARLAGQALVLSVRLGLPPHHVEQVFGPPQLTDSYKSGPLGYNGPWPVSCLYLRYGVSVTYRSDQFPRCGRATRVTGGIQ
jgi:hypothetical protein